MKIIFKEKIYIIATPILFLDMWYFATSDFCTNYKNGQIQCSMSHSLHLSAAINKKKAKILVFDLIKHFARDKSHKNSIKTISPRERIKLCHNCHMHSIMFLRRFRRLICLLIL